MQGWTPDFVPKLAEDVVAAGLIDEIVPVKGGDALRYARALAQQEGIFCGVSSGGSVFAALQLSKELENAVIVAIICDRGDRYLSSGVFSGQA